jgi:hypothetical protein
MFPGRHHSGMEPGQRAGATGDWSPVRRKGLFALNKQGPLPRTPTLVLDRIQNHEDLRAPNLAANDRLLMQVPEAIRISSTEPHRRLGGLGPTLQGTASVLASLFSTLTKRLLPPAGLGVPS